MVLESGTNAIRQKYVLWTKHFCLPKIHMLKLYPPTFEDWAFGRQLGHEDEVFVIGLVPF